MQAGIEEQSALYTKRIPIFQRSIQGNFRRIKWALLALAYAVFFGLVWLPWPRGTEPAQALLIDIAARKFYLFNFVFYPQNARPTKLVTKNSSVAAMNNSTDSKIKSCG